jgi:uncharacterized protein
VQKEATDMKVRESILFRGHPMVRALHPTTIEVTTESHLTERGDCIIGVSASKGCAQLNDDVKLALRSAQARVSISIVTEGHRFEFKARGDPSLVLSDEHDMVIRKSDFVSERTLALGADASAKDVPRGLVRVLRDPRAVGRLELEVSL